MSSLSQEESRSISENTTWGQRCRFAYGKASVAYSRFLGYDKGKNGEWVLFPDQEDQGNDKYRKAVWRYNAKYSERHFRYVTLYRITKKNNESNVIPCIHRAVNVNVNEKDRNYNPVQSSYAALWREFESLDAVIPLMNVIRMILEYYFLQFCRFDREKFIRTALEGAKEKDKEEGRESEHDSNFHMAQSLLKYIDRPGTYNDGLNFTEDSIDCDSCRHALEMIFEVMNQSQHYTRIMEEAD